MAVKCTNCGGAHPSWDCSKPRKSTAVRMDSPNQKAASQSALNASGAGTQALPVDTPPKPKMGRPRTGYIKAEYNRQYSADKRAADKLGVSVREYRASKA